LQISIFLETEEELMSSFFVVGSMRRPSFRTVFAEHHELTSNLFQSDFSLNIPVEAAQQFQSDIVALRWQLRFLFLIDAAAASLEQPLSSKNISTEDSTTTTTTLEGSRQQLSQVRSLPTTAPSVEPLHWILPLQVIAATVPPQELVRQPPLSVHL
jgi:hypothetical protein